MIGIRSTLILIGFSLSTSVIASNELYIYQAPNGEKVVTDRRLNLNNYKLIHFSGSARETGEILRSGSYNISDIDRFIRNAGALYDVDANLIRAVIRAESNFNALAISHKGARGLMQLMPTTASQYQVSSKELYDPEKNIEAGTKHLRYLLTIFNNKTNLALAAYNAGENRVKSYGGIPPFKETQIYVKRVLKYWKEYQ